METRRKTDLRHSHKNTRASDTVVSKKQADVGRETIRPSVKLNASDWAALVFLAFGIGRIDSDYYRFILLAMGVVWVLLRAKSIIHDHLLADAPTVCYAVFLILYALFGAANGGRGATWGFFGSMIIYLLLFVMYVDYRESNRLHALYKICTFMVVWVVALCVLSIAYYLQHPGAARLYMSHRGDLGGLMIGGGYDLAFLCALLIPIIVYQLPRRRIKPVFALAIPIMFVLIFMTSSAITLALSILGFLISLTTLLHGKRKIIVICLVVIASVLLFLYQDTLLSFFMTLTSGKQVTSLDNQDNALYVRINELSNMLLGGSSDDNVALMTRLQNYIRPIESILSSPFLGSIPVSGTDPNAQFFTDSQILRAIMLWGIPMGVLSLYPILATIRHYPKCMGSIVVLVGLMALNTSECFSLYAGAIIIVPILFSQSKGARIARIQVCGNLAQNNSIEERLSFRSMEGCL